MNFIGHICVAARLHPNRRLVHLGAALPDIAAMGRFRLSGADGAGDEIAHGVSVHHLTDDAFHGHDRFQGWNRTIRDELRAAGLGRGAARACGHVGTELLLDGHLLLADPALRPASVEALTGLADNPALGRLVADDRRSDWAVHLERSARWPLPDDYHQPQAVAERLNRILSRRPRLAFAPDQVALVATTLAKHQPDIDAHADNLISAVVGDVVDRASGR